MTTPMVRNTSQESSDRPQQGRALLTRLVWVVAFAGAAILFSVLGWCCAQLSIFTPRQLEDAAARAMNDLTDHAKRDTINTMQVRLESGLLSRTIEVEPQYRAAVRDALLGYSAESVGTYKPVQDIELRVEFVDESGSLSRTIGVLSGTGSLAPIVTERALRIKTESALWFGPFLKSYACLSLIRSQSLRSSDLDSAYAMLSASIRDLPATSAMPDVVSSHFEQCRQTLKNK